MLTIKPHNILFKIAQLLVIAINISPAFTLAENYTLLPYAYHDGKTYALLNIEMARTTYIKTYRGYELVKIDEEEIGQTLKRIGKYLNAEILESSVPGTDLIIIKIDYNASKKTWVDLNDFWSSIRTRQENYSFQGIPIAKSFVLAIKGTHGIGQMIADIIKEGDQTAPDNAPVAYRQQQQQQQVPIAPYHFPHAAATLALQERAELTQSDQIKIVDKVARKLINNPATLTLVNKFKADIPNLFSHASRDIAEVLQACVAAKDVTTIVSAIGNFYSKQLPNASSLIQETIGQLKNKQIKTPEAVDTIMMALEQPSYTPATPTTTTTTTARPPTSKPLITPAAVKPTQVPTTTTSTTTTTKLAIRQLYDDKIEFAKFTSKQGYNLLIQTHPKPTQQKTPMQRANTRRCTANVELIKETGPDRFHVNTPIARNSLGIASNKISSFLTKTLGQSSGKTGEDLEIVWQVPNSILSTINVTNNDQSRSCHISLADAGLLDEITAKTMLSAITKEDALIKSYLPCTTSFDRISIFIAQDKPRGQTQEIVPGRDRIIFVLGVRVTSCLANIAKVYASIMNDRSAFDPHTTIVMLQNVPHNMTINLVNRFIEYFVNSTDAWYDNASFDIHQTLFNSGWPQGTHATKK